MTQLEDVAPAFVEMAHQIVWCAAATVDRRGRPRSRVLHPYWRWADGELEGWIATGPTPVKTSDLDAHPYLSCNYWSPTQDTCSAECSAEWRTDDETCEWVWDLFKHAPAPVGYDPAIIPPWRDGPTSPAFAAIRLVPYRLRVMPGSVMMEGAGETLSWSR